MVILRLGFHVMCENIVHFFVFLRMIIVIIKEVLVPAPLVQSVYPIWYYPVGLPVIDVILQTRVRPTVVILGILMYIPGDM